MFSLNAPLAGTHFIVNFIVFQLCDGLNDGWPFRTIYLKLASAFTEEQAVLYHQRVEEISPNLRYCAYNIGESHTHLLSHTASTQSLAQTPPLHRIPNFERTGVVFSVFTYLCLYFLSSFQVGQLHGHNLIIISNSSRNNGLLCYYCKNGPCCRTKSPGCGTGPDPTPCFSPEPMRCCIAQNTSHQHLQYVALSSQSPLRPERSTWMSTFGSTARKNRIIFLLIILNTVYC